MSLLSVGMAMQRRPFCATEMTELWRQASPSTYSFFKEIEQLENGNPTSTPLLQVVADDASRATSWNEDRSKVTILLSGYARCCETALLILWLHQTSPKIVSSIADVARRWSRVEPADGPATRIFESAPECLLPPKYLKRAASELPASSELMDLRIQLIRQKLAPDVEDRGNCERLFGWKTGR